LPTVLLLLCNVIVGNLNIDKEKAIYWLSKSSKQGHALAKERLAELGNCLHLLLCPVSLITLKGNRLSLFLKT